MLCTIFCIIIGENYPFPVDIDDGYTVGDLKREIKAQKPHALASIDADALVLYQIDVDGADEDEYIRKVNALAQNLTSLKKLNMLHPLKNVWGLSGPPPRRINVLVQSPEHGPFHWFLTSLFSLLQLPKGVSGINICIYSMYASVDSVVSLNEWLQNL